MASGQISQVVVLVDVNAYLIPNLFSQSRSIDPNGEPGGFTVSVTAIIKWTMIHDERYWGSGQPLGIWMGESERA